MRDVTFAARTLMGTGLRAAHEEVEVNMKVILCDWRRVGVVQLGALDRAMLRVARHVAAATHRRVLRRGECEDAGKPEASRHIFRGRSARPVSRLCLFVCG